MGSPPLIAPVYQGVPCIRNIQKISGVSRSAARAKYTFFE